MTRSDRRHALPVAVLSASLALLLGACTPNPGPASAQPEPAAPAAGAPPASAQPLADEEADTAPRTCNADPVQGLIGQQASEDVVAKATADSGSASVRVLKPGDAATMDFRPDRLNIDTTDAGVIETLRCG